MKKEHFMHKSNIQLMVMSHPDLFGFLKGQSHMG